MGETKAMSSRGGTMSSLSSSGIFGVPVERWVLFIRAKFMWNCIALRFPLYWSDRDLLRLIRLGLKMGLCSAFVSLGRGHRFSLIWSGLAHTIWQRVACWASEGLLGSKPVQARKWERKTESTFFSTTSFISGKLLARNEQFFLTEES
jgi:hypothetical protein